MRKERVGIYLHTHDQIDSLDYAPRLLKLFEGFGELTYEKIGGEVRVCDVAEKDFQDEWQKLSFDFEGEEQLSVGKIRPSKHRFGEIQILHTVDDSVDDLISRFVKLSQSVKIDIATLAVFNFGLREDPNPMAYKQVNFNGLALKDGIPLVPWAMVLGSEYIAKFTRDKIEAAPFSRLEWLPSGDAFCQLTEHWLDMINSPDDYWVRVDQVIECLGEQHFQLSD